MPSQQSQEIFIVRLILLPRFPPLPGHSCRLTDLSDPDAGWPPTAASTGSMPDGKNCASATIESLPLEHEPRPGYSHVSTPRFSINNCPFITRTSQNSGETGSVCNCLTKGRRSWVLGIGIPQKLFPFLRHRRHRRRPVKHRNGRLILATDQCPSRHPILSRWRAQGRADALPCLGLCFRFSVGGGRVRG